MQLNNRKNSLHVTRRCTLFKQWCFTSFPFLSSRVRVILKNMLHDNNWERDLHTPSMLHCCCVLKIHQSKVDTRVLRYSYIANIAYFAGEKWIELNQILCRQIGNCLTLPPKILIRACNPEIRGNWRTTKTQKTSSQTWYYHKLWFITCQVKIGIYR